MNGWKKPEFKLLDCYSYSMKLLQIHEGKIKLYVPEAEKVSKRMHVFYNPVQEFSRNISVCAIQAFQKHSGPIRICDVLAGTGVRGLRYAKEVSGVKSITLNDKNPLAVRLIKKNIKANNLRNCSVHNEDANAILSNKIFTVVDIDPFGPPVPFLDSAARSVFWKGFLCVTATDTAPLCGTYPDACLRKYGIKSIRTDYYSELGLRILLSSIILACARYEKTFLPQLSFAHEHYYRVFGRISRGAKKCDNALKQFGFVMHCSRCANRKFGNIELDCPCGSKFDICGLIYLGNINDKKFIIEVRKQAEKRGFAKEAMLLADLSKELPLPFYYDLHYLAKTAKTRIPKIEALIKRLRKKGFAASRTHFCPTAVKTDASFTQLKKILR